LLIAKSAVGAPIGYAAVPGNNLLTTTGGGQLTPTYATSCSDLQTLLAMDDTPRVVVIDNRTIDCTNPMTVSACILPCDSSTGDTRNYYRVLTGADCSSSGGTATTTTTTKTQNSTTIFVQSNKTLLGTGTTSGISAADLYLQSTVSNVIIQNLSLTNVNPDLAQDGDAVTIDGAHHVWVDHCYFNLIGDGFVDAINSASNITLSWNHFDGRNPNACGYQHNYTHTIENATVTFHHNFYDHTLAFSPKVTLPAGKAHIFNNYWLNVLYYSIGVDKGAQALIERNDFDSSERPYWGLNGCLGKNNCAMGDSGGSNQFENIPPGSAQTKDTGGILTALPYQLTPSQIDDVSVVKAEVTQGAGPTLSP
jgi:pectate lyase